MTQAKCLVTLSPFLILLAPAMPLPWACGNVGPASGDGVGARPEPLAEDEPGRVLEGLASPDGRFAEVLWVILAARSWGLEVQRDVLEAGWWQGPVRGRSELQ